MLVKSEHQPAASLPRAGAVAQDPPPLPRISTDLLMGGRREIVLQHGPYEYRLRITSAGKLILTK